MKILKQLKKILNFNNYNKLQESINTIQNVIKTSNDDNLKENIIDAVINEIQSHPEIPVGDFMKELQEETELTNASLVAIIKQMPDIKSEKATIDVVEKLDLPSEAITEIIDEAPISPNAAQKIVEQIPDEHIQKEQQKKIETLLEEHIITKLKSIYDNCEKLNDNQLVEKILKLDITNQTSKINNQLIRIIAKKTALNCMQFGGPKIPTMTRIMSTTEMLNSDLPLLVEKEYNIIKPEYDKMEKKYRPYTLKTKQEVKLKLLENIAKKVAKDFNEVGDINIPQIPQLRTLNEYEISAFVNTVRSHCIHEQLTEEDAIRIQRLLKGETVSDLQDVNRMLSKMKSRDKEKAISDFKNLLKSSDSLKNKTEEQNELDILLNEINMKINKLPNDKKVTTAKSIILALNEQEQAMAMWKKRQNSNTER